MKYICLGYYDRSKHEAMTEAEKQAMFDTCLYTEAIPLFTVGQGRFISAFDQEHARVPAP